MAKRRPQTTWDRHSIKAELHRLGWTLTEIAAREGLHRSTLAKALNTGSGRAGEVIAKYLSIPIAELWPDRRKRSPHVIYNSDKHGPAASQKTTCPTEPLSSDREVAA